MGADILETVESDLTRYDTVHTVVDYWDGPREGIADYKGKPHYYKCLFDEQRDEWSNTFLLKPIDLQTFNLAMEAWEIWLRWEAAYREGRATMESHPALPEDRDRRQEISKLLGDRLIVDPDKDLKLQGRIEPETGGAPHQQIIPSRVRWRVRWEPGEHSQD